MSTTSVYTCCKPVLWKHDDGWDVYARRQCDRAEDGTWVPRWFDDAAVEDAPTKRAALVELANMHLLGICMVTG